MVNAEVRIFGRSTEEPLVDGAPIVNPLRLRNPQVYELHDGRRVVDRVESGLSLEVDAVKVMPAHQILRLGEGPLDLSEHERLDDLGGPP